MLSIRVVLFLTLIYFLGLRIAHLDNLTKLPERWTSFTFLATLMFTQEQGCLDLWFHAELSRATESLD